MQGAEDNRGVADHRAGSVDCRLTGTPWRDGDDERLRLRRLSQGVQRRQNGEEAESQYTPRFHDSLSLLAHRSQIECSAEEDGHLTARHIVIRAIAKRIRTAAARNSFSIQLLDPCCEDIADRYIGKDAGRRRRRV